MTGFQKIPEKNVQCTFCKNTVQSKYAIRGKSKMIFIDPNGDVVDFDKATICVTCLAKRGLL